MGRYCNFTDILQWMEENPGIPIQVIQHPGGKDVTGVMFRRAMADIMFLRSTAEEAEYFLRRGQYSAFLETNGRTIYH